MRAAYVDLALPTGTVRDGPAPGAPWGRGGARVWRDPLLGPLVLVAAGGSLVEVLGQRAVALPPVDAETARRLIGSLPLADLLAGHRGRPAVAVDELATAVVAVSQLAHELGHLLEAVDVNPLIVHPAGAVAVDALVLPR